MNGKLLGVMLVGYEERRWQPREGPERVSHSVAVLIGREVMDLDLDGPPNGNALPTGTIVDVDVEFEAKRSAIQRGGGDGGAYVGRAQLRGRAVAVRKAGGVSEPTPAAR